MVKQVTKEQVWQITGLLALAREHNNWLKDIELSIRSVLRVNKRDEGTSGVGDPGHIGDAVYSPYSVDELLAKLGIAVQKTTATKRSKKVAK